MNLTPRQRQALNELRTRFPVGSRCRYWDTKITGYRHRRTTVIGTVVLVRLAANGKYLVRVNLPDSTLDTLPETLKPVRDPAPFPDPQTGLIEHPTPTAP